MLMPVSTGVEPIPVETPSNHLFESALDVGDDKKPQQQQPPPPASDSRPATTDTTSAPTTGRAVTASAGAAPGRDGLGSRAEYMTSPAAPAVANGLIR